MKAAKNEKIMDYLSCPLDDVVDREKKSGNIGFLSNSNGKKKEFKPGFLKKKDGSGNSRFRGRGKPRFSSWKSRSFKKPYFNNRLSNSKFSKYNSKKFFKNTSNNHSSRYGSDKFKSNYNKSYVSRKAINKSSGIGYRGKMINKSRKVFKNPPTSRTVISKNLNSYKTVKVPIKKFSNLNISLHRKNRVFGLSGNRTNALSIKKNKIGALNKSKLIRKGVKKSIGGIKSRKITNGKFKPMNKYFLSKIKIVTSLNKIPSPLKEQKDTEVNLPESLNNTVKKNE
ncbi:conserved Plasmodium protein, unknown function [Plasmodium berghei]|uniref:Uncharacterized protein n=2 Tax=Plasmodium berghei TaxID=5821 RepID=A0A509AEW3_PLABA|nr:conserved Plasmodium protein, unknown function [Plasmodium berghei ANKA]CXH94322.1 conserved Plasmodium protein, unknown function [Plasmodium berghei]SCL90903.1 conserved Plasmodium protein, unknown function [Plasmodium berghei]SCM15378.1 conserved Plasmodium protein, unknown function [Plasmodium berghei]SCM17172.1 conserved Plasmodium protein, unknown function [Plasmodium berghei]SCN22202.1 conserved Plasmodium protein, unknown function [Plasmodium berghei]|eukprot:XP_034419962.1 conserved Plasmodium protein, unknown function [Plasmodium berghei ANKA]